jgi:hypothetical protein
MTCLLCYEAIIQRLHMLSLRSHLSKSSARLMGSNTTAHSNRGPKGLVSLLMFKATSGLRRSRAFGPLWNPSCLASVIHFEIRALSTWRYSTTNSIGPRSVLKRQHSLHGVKKWTAFYETQIFITVFKAPVTPEPVESSPRSHILILYYLL